MAQIFPRWTNYIPHAVTVGAPFALVAVTAAIWYWFSPKYTDVGYMPEQPVPYSHKLHAGDLGMDCRYCHNTVEQAAVAAVPPTNTCMNCHKIIRQDSPKLEVIRASFKSGEAVPWVRVHQLPDYAYFNHSVHLAGGVGCVSCHGRVDQMDEVTLSQPLSMGWCLTCHMAVGDMVKAQKAGQPPVAQNYLRPLDRVTDLAFDPIAEQYDPFKDPHRARPATDLNPPIHCSGCHR